MVHCEFHFTQASQISQFWNLISFIIFAPVSSFPNLQAKFENVSNRF